MMPPKRKEVSSTTGEQTGRQTRVSSRVVSSASASAPSTSSASATAPSASSSISPDTSSSVGSSRRNTRARPARAASQATNGRSVSGNVRSRQSASSSPNPTSSSSVSSPVRDTQSAAASSTETQEEAIGGDTTRAGPNAPTSRATSSQDVQDRPMSARDNTYTTPSEVDQIEQDFRFVNRINFANDSSPPPDWDTTVDLTSPARPSITRAVFSPIMRRLSESLLQQDQGDLTDDFSELTFTSPTNTPPRNAHTLRPLRYTWSPRPNGGVNMYPNPPQGEVLQPVSPPQRNNHMDITIDLTDSPAPAASASPEGSSLDPAPGPTSHIRCPVCLDDLPQIISTRRTLMSTVCGHVFCSSCLPLCIRSNGRCPSCRKLLNPNQIHPIFL